MSKHRISHSRRGAAIALVVWSWIAVVVALGHSVAFAQQPEAATSDDAALPESQPLPTVAPDLSRLLASYQRTPSRTRLASVPKMFGDSISHIAGFTAQVNESGEGSTPVSVDLPIGNSHASKIADHNAALPVDRVYFNFNHFHNALDATVGANPVTATNSQSINRYIFGWERTFLDELWSVELRMPFTETYGLAGANAGLIPGGIASGGGNVGNLAVVLKRMIYETDDAILALGLVLDTPTGKSTFARIGTTNYSIDNNVMGILPYLGLLYAPHDRHFLNAFLQADIPLGDNVVHSAGTVLGDFTQPTWMYLDVSGGYWLYQDPSARRLTGLAALLELHYATALHHGQSLTTPNDAETFSAFGGSRHNDVVNLTAALNAQLANMWVLRVGAIVPLSSNHRFFDSEVAVQATRYF